MPAITCRRAARGQRTRSSRRATRSAAPGICSAIPASARTPTCTRSAIRSGRGRAARRSPTARRSSTYVRETAARVRHRPADPLRPRVDARGVVDARTRAGRSRRATRTAATVELTCSFLYMCAGYYDYDGGYTPEFPGASASAAASCIRSSGRRRHRLRRQARRRDRQRRDRGDARARAREAGAHVTMLQRSPTYIVSLPARRSARELAARHAAAPSRVRRHALEEHAARHGASTATAARYPERAKKLHRRAGRASSSAAGYDVERTSRRRYKPWDQRLCLVPDARSVRGDQQGSASVVTDHIETFTETRHRGCVGRGARRPTSSSRRPGSSCKCLGGIELDGRRHARRSAETHGLQGHDVQRRAEPRVRDRLHERVVDAQVRPDQRVRVPPAQPHATHGYSACMPRRDPGDRARCR